MSAPGLAPEIPAEYKTRLFPELRELRVRIADALDAAEANRLVSDGKAIAIDDALAAARAWLQES